MTEIFESWQEKKLKSLLGKRVGLLYNKGSHTEKKTGRLIKTKHSFFKTEVYALMKKDDLDYINPYNVTEIAEINIRRKK